MEPRLYGRRMRDLARADRWAQVLEMLRAVEIHELEANIVLYNTALSACKGLWRTALDLTVGDLLADRIRALARAILIA